MDAIDGRRTSIVRTAPTRGWDSSAPESPCSDASRVAIYSDASDGMQLCSSCLFGGLRRRGSYHLNVSAFSDQAITAAGLDRGRTPSRWCPMHVASTTAMAITIVTFDSYVTDLMGELGQPTCARQSVPGKGDVPPFC